MAKTSKLPARTIPSRASSFPGRNSSTRMGPRTPSATSMMAAMREAAAAAASGPSARITPRLAESLVGFKTTGNPISSASATACDRSSATRNRAWLTPASPNADRIAALSRVILTACGSAWRRPSRVEARAAVSDPWSSTAMMASNGRLAAACSISRAPRPGSSSGSTMNRSPIVPAIACGRSEASTSSAP